MAGLLRLFEIPAPPTPREAKKGERGSRGSNSKPGSQTVHVPFKRKMAPLISLFAREYMDESVTAETYTQGDVEVNEQSGRVCTSSRRSTADSA